METGQQLVATPQPVAHNPAVCGVCAGTVPADLWGSTVGDLSYEEMKRIMSGSWIMPPSTLYDFPHLQVKRGGIRHAFTPQREEETVTDKAVELLAQQRFEEAQEKAQAEAEAIVEKVKALNVASYNHNDKVMFTKTMPVQSGDEKTYTYLALRVVEGDKKMWFVTNRPSSLNDFAFESLLARDGGFVAFGQLAVMGPIKASNYMGWGADVNAPLTSNVKGAPVQTKYEDPTSTHAVGPAEPGEE